MNRTIHVIQNGLFPEILGVHKLFVGIARPLISTYMFTGPAPWAAGATSNPAEPRIVNNGSILTGKKQMCLK